MQRMPNKKYDKRRALFCKLLGESNDPEKTYTEKIMPDKLKLNLKYIEEQSLLVDIKVIFKTILKII